MKRRRPTHIEKEQAFLEIVSFLKENEDEQMSVSELAKKMDEMFPGIISLF